jgi:hypothetical protein
VSQRAYCKLADTIKLHFCTKVLLKGESCQFTSALSALTLFRQNFGQFCDIFLWATQKKGIPVDVRGKGIVVREQYRRDSLGHAFEESNASSARTSWAKYETRIAKCLGISLLEHGAIWLIEVPIPKGCRVFDENIRSQKPQCEQTSPNDRSWCPLK